VDFSHDYFDAGITIVSQAPEPKTSLMSSALPKFVSPETVNVLAFAFLFLIVVGHLLWYFERKVQPDNFHGSYARGVDEGIWLAMVTMTTVGYGDRYPVTGPGRCVAALWMILSLLVLSSLTGVMTAVIVEDRATGSVPADAKSLAGGGKHVCAGPGYFEAWLKSKTPRISYSIDATDAECLERLRRGEVYAALQDTPVAFGMFQTGDFPGLVASPIVWPGNFAAALPSGGYQDLKSEFQSATLEYVLPFEGGATTATTFEDSRAKHFADWDGDVNGFLYSSAVMNDGDLGAAGSAEYESWLLWLCLCFVVMYAGVVLYNHLGDTKEREARRKEREAANEDRRRRLGR